MFTNVPVHATIEIILQHIYHHTSLPPLKISPNILRKLLLACTTQVPFYDHKDNIYIQIDGVSMGSALGPLFANFYMGHLEDKIFQLIDKPSIYLRYVDDILVLTEKVSDIENLKQVLHSNSVLSSLMNLMLIIKTLSSMSLLTLTGIILKLQLIKNPLVLTLV